MHPLNDVNEKTQLTNPMETRPSWKATRCTITQEFTNILWNSKVHYYVHKNMSPPPVHILSQINPVETTPSYLAEIILILLTHLCLGLHGNLFPTVFLTKVLYAFLFSRIRATCPALLIILNLII
jgi:hypothetical protein